MMGINGILKIDCDRCGKTKSIGKFQGGIPIGEHKFWDCEGFLLYKYTFINGIDEVEQKFYYYVESSEDYDGDKVKCIFYKKGSYVEKKYYSQW